VFSVCIKHELGSSASVTLYLKPQRFKSLFYFCCQNDEGW
jgi:hypothetical protein